MTVNFVKCYILLILFLRCYCIVELQCGEQYEPPPTYIGGGREVEDYEHPWFCDYDVVNFDGSLTHCGGTLISREYIVTAAHCFDGREHDLISDSVANLTCGIKKSRILLNVTRIIKHPGWDAHSHDIAVIQIPKIAYSTVLRPACVISNEKLLENSKVTVVGTGDTHFPFGRPKHAQTAEIYLKDALLCQEQYGLGEKSEQNNLCAGKFLTAVKSGDEGGPLLVLYNMRYYLVGVISTRKGNFITDFYQNMSPVVFTKIKAECEFFKEHTDFECYSNSIPLRESDKKKHVCGHTTVLSNGTTLHPWYCRIYDTKGIDFCGATLISFSHAVTAAHCVKSEEHQLDLRTSYIKCGLRHQQRQLKRIKISSGYKEEIANDDIAVLELKEEIRYDGETVPICFLPKNHVLDREMTAVGMSHNNYEYKYEKRVVSEFPVDKIEHIYCQQWGLKGIDDNAICTRMKDQMMSKGDSGSPLVTTIMFYDQPKYFIVGVVSKGKRESSIVSFARVQSFNDLISNFSDVLPTELECGKQHETLNILIGGGREVEDYEHPWFCDYDVIHFDGTSKHCGGTLVSHEYIVTAAHCFDKAGSISLHKKVRNLKCGAKNNKFLLNVTRIIKHPEWNNTFHDIAMIEIPKVAYSMTLRPACIISREKLLLDSKLIVVKTKYTNWTSRSFKHAQTADIYLKDALLCQKKYDLGEKSEQNNLCAGARWTAVKSGDEGGPLLVLYNMRYYLVGVISTRKGDILKDFRQDKHPVLFTRIKTECEFFKEHTDFECYSNSIPLKESDIESHICGHTTVLSNGTNLHPWYCRIYDTKGVDFCGATLISFSHAITAAHCVKSEENQLDLETSYIKCGLRQARGWLKNIIISPEHGNNSVKNNIVILEVEAEFRYDGWTMPICLLPENYMLNKEMAVIEMHHKHNKTTHRQKIVSKFPVKVIHKSHCFSSELKRVNNTICMKMENHTIHNRDIGGPLVTIVPINGEPKYFITGIILQINKETNAVSTIKVQSFNDYFFQVLGLQPLNIVDNQESRNLSTIILSGVLIFVYIYIWIYIDVRIIYIFREE